ADGARLDRLRERPVDPHRLVALDEVAADEVAAGQVLVAGDGDQVAVRAAVPGGAAQLSRHVLDEARLAATGRTLQEDRQAALVGGREEGELVADGEVEGLRAHPGDTRGGGGARQRGLRALDASGSAPPGTGAPREARRRPSRPRSCAPPAPWTRRAGRHAARRTRRSPPPGTVVDGSPRVLSPEPFASRCPPAQPGAGAGRASPRSLVPSCAPTCLLLCLQHERPATGGSWKQSSAVWLS